MTTSFSQRLLSLDVFRGLTIVGMILVNSPGNEKAYKIFYHSPWNGCTPADLVFPFFIFIMGVSLTFSLTKQKEQALPLRSLMLKILQRTLLIFLLGLFLNAFPRHFNWDTLRLPGVLQRIALCYFFAALLFLTTKTRTQVWITASLLLGYWLSLSLILAPGGGTPLLTPEDNLAAYLDRFIFTPAHLYQPTYDPEGLLSTLPALATALIGTLTGQGLLSSKKETFKLGGLSVIGLLLAATGWFWGLFFPINKALWTSSFVLWTGGLALLLFALIYGLVDYKRWRLGSKPFEIFGVNALAAYFLHIFFLKIQALIPLPRLDGSTGNLRFFLTEHLFPFASLKMASCLYALSYTLLWLLILSWLYRKKIFIRF
jgi:predicted acyltransferase